MKFLRELLPYAIIILAVLLIRTFIVTPVVVDGKSMLPNLIDGQVLILKKYDHKIDRFDIVVVNYNGDRLIKRVIGLPGEYVEYKDSNLYINGENVAEDMVSETTYDFKLENIGYDVIPEDYYFVIGDNRKISKDSRVIGLIDKKNILGVVGLSIYPFNRFGFVK